MHRRWGQRARATGLWRTCRGAWRVACDSRHPTFCLTCLCSLNQVMRQKPMSRAQRRFRTSAISTNFCGEACSCPSSVPSARSFSAPSPHLHACRLHLYSRLSSASARTATNTQNERAGASKRRQPRGVCATSTSAWLRRLPGAFRRLVSTRASARVRGLRAIWR